MSAPTTINVTRLDDGFYVVTGSHGESSELTRDEALYEVAHRIIANEMAFAPSRRDVDQLPPPPTDDPEIVRVEIPHDRLPSFRQLFVDHMFFEVPGNNAYEALRMVNGQRATLVVYQNKNERLKVVAGPDQPAVRGLLRAWRDRP